jgi:hypothetical protein
MYSLYFTAYIGFIVFHEHASRLERYWSLFSSRIVKLGVEVYRYSPIGYCKYIEYISRRTLKGSTFLSRSGRLDLQRVFMFCSVSRQHP